jgi:hypothetical protein
MERQRSVREGMLKGLTVNMLKSMKRQTLPAGLRMEPEYL